MKDLLKELEIIGQGGKGGSRTPREAPNTLQSRSTIRLVEVISEGEIKGVVGDLKGVYFDDTPVQNTDDSFNFPAVLYESRNGTDPQEYLPGFTEQESSTDVNVELTTTGITQSTSDNTVDAMRVHVRLPQGLSLLNPENGDLNGYSVGIAIDTRATGGTFSQVFAKTITGKTTSAYEEAYRIEKPAGISTTWEVRVRRTTNPGGTSNIADRVDWAFKTELRDIQVGYEDAAVVGIAVDSESTGGNAPRRSYLTDGIICQVPTNYSPTVYNPDGTVASWAVYSGIWNGVFKYEWTDDPAWILYDLLTNTRYGMGNYIDSSTIDVYSFYNAAQYNNVLVPNEEDGVTTYEPRFRWNGVIQTREDAFKAIQAVAATMRAMVFSGPGYIKLIQDRPTAASAIITNANVIDGKFNYRGTELTDRITSCDVTYNDQYDRYLPRTINFQAEPGIISAYGFNKMEIAAIGITSEGQARRLAKWAVDTSINSYDICDFTVSWNNAFVEIGDVVNIIDDMIPLNHQSGLIKGGSTTTIILDRSVTIPGSSSIKYINNLGVEVTRTISNSAGTYTTLTINSGENMSLYTGSAWGIFTGSNPRPFKIIGVSEDEPGNYKITATFHDVSKYARVEEGIIVDPPLFEGIGGFSIRQPGAMSFSTETFTDPYGGVLTRIRVTWPPNTESLLRGYKIRWRKDATQYVWTPELNQNEFVLENAQPGLYEFNLYAYNNRGIQSPVRTAYYQLEVEVGDSPLNPPSAFALCKGGTNFEGSSFCTTWVAPSTSTLAVLKDYSIEFLDVSNNVVHRFFQENIGFTVSNTEIGQWYGIITRAIKIRLRSRDTQLRLSSSTTVTFNNAAVAVPTGIDIVPFWQYYTVNHNMPSETDYAGVLIHHSLTSGFTPSSANLVKDDVGTSHLVEAEPGTTYYVRIAAYDSWGRDELLYSSELEITTADDQIGLTPDAPTGLTVTSTIITQPTGSQSARINMTWNDVSGMNQYDLEIIEYQGITATGVFNVLVPGTDSRRQTYQHDAGIPSRTYRVRVRARSMSAVSVWSDQVSHTASGDSTPPSLPTVISVTPGFRMVVLRWENAPEVDLAGTKIQATQNENLGWYYLDTVAAPLSHFIHSNLAIPGVTPPEAGGSLPWKYRIYSVDNSGNESDMVIIDNAGAGYFPLNVGENVITAFHIAANTITAAEILAGTITATQIAASTITATQIAANTITADRINVGSLSAVLISAGYITTGNLSAISINANQITSGLITAAQINVTNLLASSAFINNLTVQSANLINLAVYNAKIGGDIFSDTFNGQRTTKANDAATTLTTTGTGNGTTGWIVRRNGDAVFNNLFARGDFSAGSTGSGVRLLLSTSDPTYVMWYGTGATVNDANAKFYLKKDGSAYFGGSLISGIVNTSIQVDNGTGAGGNGADNVTAIVGPYNALSNGNTKIYFTFKYHGYKIITQADPACSNNNGIMKDRWTFTLERSFNGSSWTTVGTPFSTPTLDSAQAPGILSYVLDGTDCAKEQTYQFVNTISDSDATGGTRYYRMRITARSYWSGTGTNPTAAQNYHQGVERIQQLLALQVTQSA